MEVAAEIEHSGAKALCAVPMGLGHPPNLFAASARLKVVV
jgi:hypothetical protein